MEMEYWGKHYLADCRSCDKELIKSESNIAAFVTALINKIDMKAYGTTQMAHFATHDPSKGGYTFTQMIETSLIDGHLVDETGDAYISVHSCKPFDEKVVDEVIQQFFNPIKITGTTVKRQA